MSKKIKRWLIYTFISTIVGFILGYALLWAWFFFSLLILGYGDSGPPWINAVTNFVFWVGLAIGILGGQMIFFTKIFKGR
jgi:hypothetical protein